MYAIIESNKLRISIAEFYNAAWYGKNRLISGKEKFEFEYGNLEIDIHKNGKKYLTGFVIDPRKFIVDYIQTRYRKSFPVPKRIVSVSLDASEHVELFEVEFIKTRSFVINGMEKDLIFPLFTRRRGQLTIQGFEVLSVFSMLKYLVKRFKFKGTTRIRHGNRVYDLKTDRRWNLEKNKQ